MPTNDIAETLGSTAVVNQDPNINNDGNTVKQQRKSICELQESPKSDVSDPSDNNKSNQDVLNLGRKSPYDRLLSSVTSSTTSLPTLSKTTTIDSIESYNRHIEEDSIISENFTATSLTDFFSKNQIRPQTTSILKPGSIFVGSQQSGKSTYEVEVELKSVDLSKSYLSGYLKIQGLTESHPEIITFFESEIISEDYSFFTENKEWGSNDKIDIQHWTKFYDWKNQLPIKKILEKKYIHKNFLNHNNIYMRWKERFLVPDAKIENIDGASFAGFYYISFNQKNGNIIGLYFHKSSEKFQQLELSHVSNRGVNAGYQFQ